MKKFTSPIVLFGLLGILLLYSCKKDIAGLFSGKDELLTDIDWAKTYYTQNLAQKSSNNTNLMAANGLAKENKKTPIWTKSKAGNTSFYTFVEVPLKYGYKVSPTLMISKDPLQTPIANKEIIDASFDRLIIFKDKNEKINQRIPDQDYLRKHRGNIEHNKIDDLDEDFFGYLHYKDWDGKALFVLRIEKGKPVKKYDMQKSISGKIKNSSTAQKPEKNQIMVLPAVDGNCYFIEWDWYQDCYYPNEEATVPTYCDPVQVYNVQYVQVPCPPDGGDGDGDGGGPSPEPEPQCLGILVFETGECIVDPVTPCDFVREAAKNPKFKQRMDALAANVAGNTEKAYAINYATHYVQYAEGVVNDPYVSLGIGA